MARNNKITTHLRNTTRGASFVEYTALLGLLGVLSIGAVFAFGLNVQDNTETIQARVDTVAALAAGSAPGDGASGGSGGTGTGGGTTPPPPPPPVDVFASCETGFGPNPAAIRGNGDGSLLSGGNDSQIIYALADALVDGGEGGGDFDILMVPGTGAVATFDTVNPETGRVDLPGGGAVVFSNIESVYLCDEGGEAFPPPPPPFEQVGAPGSVALTYHAFYLGTVSDLDPAEGNGTAENASAIVGMTFGSVGSPLLDSVVVATPNDGNSNGSVAFNTANERFSFAGGVLNANPYTPDTAVSVNGTLTFEDGTTGTGIFLLGLFESGATRHLVLLPPSTAGAQSTLLASAPVVSLQIGSIASSSVASIGASRVDPNVWVRR